MRKELKAEYAKEQFYSAMSEFQAACPIIKKTKAVHTKSGIVAYRYAPIDSIVFQTKDLIRHYGFSYSVDTTPYDGRVEVTICVSHKLGHENSVKVNLPFVERTAMMTNAQVESATMTLAMRRAFCNAFGILTGDEDNDARKQVVYASDEQLDEIKSLVGMTKYTQEQLLKGYKVVSGAELTVEQAHTFIDQLKRYVEKQISEKDGNV